MRDGPSCTILHGSDGTSNPRSPHIGVMRHHDVCRRSLDRWHKGHGLVERQLACRHRVRQVAKLGRPGKSELTVWINASVGEYHFGCHSASRSRKRAWSCPQPPGPAEPPRYVSTTSALPQFG